MAFKACPAAGSVAAGGCPCLTALIELLSRLCCAHSMSADIAVSAPLPCAEADVQEVRAEEVDVDGRAGEERKGRAALSTEEKKRLANKRKKEKAKQRKQQQTQQTSMEMRQLASSFPSLSMHRYFQPPLSLAFNARQGRHLLLSSPLPTHTLLFSQLPYAAVVTDSHSAVVCHRCLSSESSVMLKCSVCQFAHYCSSTCKRAHEKVHSVECGLLQQLVRMQGSSASIRLLVRLLLQRREEDELTLKLREKIKTLRKKGNTAAATSNSLPASLHPGQTFVDVDGLQSHVDELDSQKRLELLTLLASLRTLLGAAFDSLGSDEVMLRLLCIVQVNAHHITDFNKAKVALGLFTAPSLMNHSCWPTAFYYFSAERGEMHMRLLSDAVQGAELTYAYTDVYQRRSERWRVLQELYHIPGGCECVRCSVPLEASWDRYIEGMQCNTCRDGLVVRRGGQAGWLCDKCSRSFTQQQVDECREDAELISRQALSLLSAQHFEPLVNAVQSKLLHPACTTSQPLRLHPHSDLCFQSYFLLMSALPAVPSLPPASSSSSSLSDCCRLAVECMEGATLTAMVEWSDVLVVWGEAEVREGRVEEGCRRLEQARERRERQYGKKHLLTRDVTLKLHAASSLSSNRDQSN